MFNFEAVNSLLQHKRIKVGTVDAYGRNCLFYALRNESEEECYQMIRAIVSMDQSLVKEFSNLGKLNQLRRDKYSHLGNIKEITAGRRTSAQQPG